MCSTSTSSQEIEEEQPQTLGDKAISSTYGGNLSQGFLTGSFTKNNNSIYYTLPTSDYRGLWGIMTSAQYDISISVYYSDTDPSHPFLTGTNYISVIPTYYNRTTYILLQNNNFNHPSFSFGVSATELDSSDYDYIKYNISSKTMGLYGYSATVSNLNYVPIGNTIVDESDLDLIDNDGLQNVLATGSPYDSVAQMISTHYYGSSNHLGTGTAFRIRPNVFATNGHMVFDKDYFSFVHSATLFPERDSINAVSINIVSYSIPLRYFLETNDFDYDFAIVETINDTSTDSLGMNAVETLSENDEIYMLGYPTPSSHNYMQQFSSGEIYEISTQVPTMLTTLPADGNIYGGSSGSPVFKNGYVIGINNGSVSFYNSNNIKIACYEHAILFDSDIQSFVVTRLLANI